MYGNRHTCKEIHSHPFFLKQEANLGYNLYSHFGDMDVEEIIYYKKENNSRPTNDIGQWTSVTGTLGEVGTNGMDSLSPCNMQPVPALLHRDPGGAVRS
jgi:hypothetical protein